MKRILLDQGLAPHAAAILRRNGLDAAHVSEIGMERAEDIQIMEKARIDERVCVTLDHDFHAHLAMTGHGRPSVILLRVQGLDAQRHRTSASQQKHLHRCATNQFRGIHRISPAGASTAPVLRTAARSE
jgi:predicted nuclease of predicted toxin-antitoxin system